MLKDDTIDARRIHLSAADEETRKLVGVLTDLLEEACGHEDAPHAMEAGCNLDGPLLKGFYLLGYPFEEAARHIWGDDYKQFVLEPGESEENLGYRINDHRFGVNDVQDPENFRTAVRNAVKEAVDVFCETELAAELEEDENLSGPVVKAHQALGYSFEKAAERIWGPDWEEELAAESPAP